VVAAVAMAVVGVVVGVVVAVVVVGDAARAGAVAVEAGYNSDWAPRRVSLTRVFRPLCAAASLRCSPPSFRCELGFCEIVFFAVFTEVRLPCLYVLSSIPYTERRSLPY
jgi:hypothetical protein